MPIYVYRCPRCGVTAEQQKKVAERDDAPACVECHAAMERAPAAPQGYFPGAATWRGGA